MITGPMGIGAHLGSEITLTRQANQSSQSKEWVKWRQIQMQVQRVGNGCSGQVCELAPGSLWGMTLRLSSRPT
jgi:hypothetical protein